MVLNHFQLAFLPELLSNLSDFLGKFDSWILTYLVLGLVNIVLNGELAVYIFWFLSAYVISIRLFTTADLSYVTSAFSKRYIRLALPVLTSVFLSYAFLSLGWMHNQEVALQQANHWLSDYYNFDFDLYSAVKSGLWDTFFRSKLNEYNPVLWTINPELYGSFVCFVLFLIFRKNKFQLHFCLFIGGIALLLDKYWLVTFILGYSLCAVHYEERLELITRRISVLFKNQGLNSILFLCLLIAGGIYSYLFGGRYRDYSIFYVPVSGLIIMLLTQTPKLQKFFARSYFVWLGRVSFSLYLIHFPVICSIGCFAYLHLPFENTLKVVFLGVGILVICLAIAYLFTKYIDEFSKSIANQFGRFVSRHDME